MEQIIRVYKMADHTCPFDEWMKKLRDEKARAAIDARILRLSVGNFGVCEPVGEGILELKVDTGPGYRVYLTKIKLTVVLLLCVGSKKTQPKDIALAKKYADDFKRRGMPI